MREQYNFNISLSVLNHLGRNLYRNVITVIGEAISNSWDADAHNVWLNIDRETNCMSVIDDGIGMTDEDFQDRFLKIGYSKRKGGHYTSALGRPYIGRKGIGKLALLSCSKKIHILSKTKDTEVIGGIIDNTSLDKAITDDMNSQDYILEPIDITKKSLINDLEHGTVIIFESISDGITNTIDYIKKAIALYFRFSLYDASFSISVNGEPITMSCLSDISENTQFLWKINGFAEPFISSMHNIQVQSSLNSTIDIKGYIASVNKPSQLKIRGTQEKVSIDLFVNGRLREKDILRHIPSARIVENYVYGQIHYDSLDQGDNKDVFTSSRESVISDDPLFASFLKELDRLFKKVIDEWDDFRRRHGDDGDPDNPKVPRKARKAQELFHAAYDDFKADSNVGKKGGKVEEWAGQLADEAQFNIPCYTECFISENLLRKYIEHVELALTEEAQKEAEKWRSRDKANKDKANISYEIRASTDDIYFLDMDHLANLIDKPENPTKDAGIGRSAIVYKPIRDAVGHTSIITDTAKSQLDIEYQNIKSRLLEVLQQFEEA